VFPDKDAGFRSSIAALIMEYHFSYEDIRILTYTQFFYLLDVINTKYSTEEHPKHNTLQNSLSGDDPLQANILRQKFGKKE